MDPLLENLADRIIGGAAKISKINSCDTSAGSDSWPFRCSRMPYLPGFMVGSLHLIAVLLMYTALTLPWLEFEIWHRDMFVWTKPVPWMVTSRYVFLSCSVGDREVKVRELAAYICIWSGPRDMVPLRLVTFIRREVGPALLAGMGQMMLVMLTIIPRMRRKVSEWLRSLNSLFHAVEVKHGRLRATSGWVTFKG